MSVVFTYVIKGSERDPHFYVLFVVLSNSFGQLFVLSVKLQSYYGRGSSFEVSGLLSDTFDTRQCYDVAS